MTRRTSHILFSALTAIAVLLSACAAPTTQAPEPTQGQAQPTAAPDQPTAPAGPTEAMEAEAVVLPKFLAPDEAEGDIITAGSSTVFPVTERMAERFEQEGYLGSITVDSIGTGAGFERFCVSGETDISNASRAINAREIAACGAIGRSPVEFRVGTDALAVVVNTENDFVDYLTLAELTAAFSTAATWAEVRAGWPAEPIQRFSPGTDSGTFDYFIEAVMAPANPVDGRANVDAGEKAILDSNGTQFSEDDNVLVQGVEGGPYALGYFGYAYFAAEAGNLKAVPIARTDPAGAVAPSQETVDAGTYPLARPLFIYSDPQILQDKPQVAAFIKFYLDSLDENIVDVGYFPAPKSAISKAYGRLVYAVGGLDVDAASALGDIISAGSSTVFPLTERMSELFQQEGYGDSITVDSIGTGAGFERFCVSGETDISNASRPIREAEVTSCTGIGRTPLEFRVGTDALAVVVSAENDFVDYLTLAELATAFSTAATWAEVRAGWPAEPIQRFSPGTDSGTFDYFIEAVMQPANGGDADAGEAALLNSAGTQFSEDDNVLAQGVEGGPYALGYFGYAYFAAEAGNLKAVPIAKDADATPVTPDLASVNAATYPLARPLFIYSDATILAEKPQVAQFIAFYLSNVNTEIVDVGYFPAPANALGDAVANLLAALGLQP